MDRQALVRDTSRSDNPFRIGYIAAPQLLAIGPFPCFLSHLSLSLWKICQINSRKPLLSLQGSQMSHYPTDNSYSTQQHCSDFQTTVWLPTTSQRRIFTLFFDVFSTTVTDTDCHYHFQRSLIQTATVTFSDHWYELPPLSSAIDSRHPTTTATDIGNQQQQQFRSPRFRFQQQFRSQSFWLRSNFLSFAR